MNLKTTMGKNKTISIIIAAAGNSSRMKNESKQFILLNNKPLLLYSLEKFSLLKNIIEIIIVTNDLNATRSLLESQASSYVLEKTKIILGGDLRMDSVYNGFCKVNPTVDLVLIHDVARPLFDIKDVENCIEKASVTGAAVLAVRVVDTVKKSKYDGDELVVERTIDRNGLYLIQTPQVISYALLLKGYKNLNKEKVCATDEATMVELLGESVSLVCGSRKNIKITYPEDLEIANRIYRICPIHSANPIQLEELAGGSSSLS